MDPVIILVIAIGIIGGLYFYNYKKGLSINDLLPCSERRVKRLTL